MGLEVLGKVQHGVVAAPFGGKQQALGSQIVHDSDVVLPTPQACLVDAHGTYLAHVVDCAGLLNIVLNAPPQGLVGTTQQCSGLPHRQLTAQRQRQASNSAVKPEPSRAQGTPTCVVLPQPVQATRGTSACSQASNWKKSRCRHERRRRSWMPCAGVLQCGQLSNLALQRTSKSMRRLAVSRSTLATSHGATKPNALANSVSTPTLTRQPPVHALQGRMGMWTSRSATCPHAHTALRPPPIVAVGFHTKRRGAL